jgi:hypothetical protein
MWKNIAEPVRQQVTIWRMRFMCSITKATDKRLEYGIFTAFQSLKWQHEGASILRFTYIDCPERQLLQHPAI